MKKTFILAGSLFAASAMAQTELPLTLTTTFTSHAPEVESEYITGVSLECTDTHLSANGALASASGNYVPNANIGNGATWTATFSYTLADAVQSLSISSIDISSLLCNSGGVAHSDTKARGVVFTVSINGSEVGTAEWTGTGNGGNGGILPVQTFTLTDAVTLTDDFTLSIKATRPVTDGVNYQGGFIGLSGVALTGTVTVPEPATATLSLLALAGLAARRRRK